MDRNETFEARILNQNGSQWTWIGLSTHTFSPAICRIQKNIPLDKSSWLPRLNPSSSIWNSTPSLDEVCPIAAIGAAAYFLYIREEEYGMVSYRNFFDKESLSFVDKETAQQLYLAKYISEWFADKPSLLARLQGGGQYELYIKDQILPKHIEQERKHLAASKKLGYIGREIVVEVEEYLARIGSTGAQEAEATSAQGEAPTYLFNANGIPLGSILSILKEASLVEQNLSIKEFSRLVRNGSLSCIKIKTYKKILIKELSERLGSEWRASTLMNEQISEDSIKKQNTSRKNYNTFLLDIRRSLAKTEH